MPNVFQNLKISKSQNHKMRIGQINWCMFFPLGLEAQGLPGAWFPVLLVKRYKIAARWTLCDSFNQFPENTRNSLNTMNSTTSESHESRKVSLKVRTHNLESMRNYSKSHLPVFDIQDPPLLLHFPLAASQCSSLVHAYRSKPARLALEQMSTCHFRSWSASRC